MIVYAIFSSSAGAKVDIEDLFVAGIGPGILIGLMLGGYCILNSKGVARETFDLNKLIEALLDGVWALFLPSSSWAASTPVSSTPPRPGD